MTQAKALEILKRGDNTFLTGEPGSGKTHTVNLFTEWLRSQNIPYAVTASTGIAATHIGGITIHSWTGLGIKQNVTDAQIELIMTKPYVVERILHAKVLIIDEISMLDATILNDIDRVLRAIRGTILTGEPFGGLQIVFVGDFFQLPPVSKGKSEVKFAFESEAWIDADPVICYLHEQHRQEDQKFLEILTAIRQGEVTEEHTKALRPTGDHAERQKYTKLFTHNIDVDRINNEMLQNLKGEKRVFLMESSGIPFIVETLKKNCLSPERLSLKIGALVMFTRNNFEDGYVNGTLGTVIRYSDDGDPVVETKDSDIITVLPCKWEIEEDGYVKAMISQYPLRLAYAITVHKSQGMSLDSAQIDLSRCFEYGQGYVAISRVRSLGGLYLNGFNDMALKMHPRIIEQDNIFREQSDAME